MFKGLAIMIGGIFVGAVGMEILRRKCPHGLDSLYAKTREMTSAARDAFKVGYENVTRPEPVAEPTA
jgi:hypothetical protein